MIRSSLSDWVKCCWRRVSLQPAVGCAQQALDVNPRLAQAWLLRAQAMQRGHQPRQALADYHRALSCDRGNRKRCCRWPNCTGN